jgi:hypothetical protein
MLWKHNLHFVCCYWAQLLHEKRGHVWCSPYVGKPTKYTHTHTYTTENYTHTLCLSLFEQDRWNKKHTTPNKSSGIAFHQHTRKYSPKYFSWNAFHKHTHTLISSSTHTKFKIRDNKKTTGSSSFSQLCQHATDGRYLSVVWWRWYRLDSSSKTLPHKYDF